MNNLEYDSYHKFIVSLGITLIMIPIVLFNIFITGVFNEQISEEEYAKLRPSAQNFIITKESFSDAILQYKLIILAFFAIMIFIGVILIVLGSRKWKNIQKKMDRQVELELLDKEIKFRQATPEEIKEKQAQEKSFSGEFGSTEKEESLSSEKMIQDWFINKYRHKYDIIYTDVAIYSEHGQKVVADAVAEQRVSRHRDVYEFYYITGDVSTVSFDRLITNYVLRKEKLTETISSNSATKYRMYALIVVQTSAIADIIREKLKSSGLDQDKFIIIDEKTLISELNDSNSKTC